MGCYGLGLTRLIGAVVEANNDENGIIWPKEFAPFDVCLIAVGSNDRLTDKAIRTAAEKLYADLQKRGLEVIYDDRSGVSAGEKFKDCDLLGVPHRLVNQ